jgi:anti-sigma regulatory factor (Ser/Thr protein kinase)
LPPHPASARAARRFVEQVLVEEGASQALIDTFAVMVSELTTNSVLHAHSDIVVRLTDEQGLRIEVTDGAGALPVPRPPGGEGATGRGLHIVAALADDFGVDLLPSGGKTVWAAIPTRPMWRSRSRDGRSSLLLDRATDRS